MREDEQVQLPKESTVALQSVPRIPSTIVTRLPASPVPVKVGVLSFTKLPSVGREIVGTFGLRVSTVKVTSEEGALSLPAVSLAVAVTVCPPSSNVTVDEQVHEPEPLVTAVQSTPAEPSVTVTVLPASAVPLKLGVVSFVKRPEIGEVITGAFGATVSTVKLTDGELPLAFPA